MESPFHFSAQNSTNSRLARCFVFSGTGVPVRGARRHDFIRGKHLRCVAHYLDGIAKNRCWTVRPMAEARKGARQQSEGAGLGVSG